MNKPLFFDNNQPVIIPGTIEHITEVLATIADNLKASISSGVIIVHLFKLMNPYLL